MSEKNNPESTWYLLVWVVLIMVTWTILMFKSESLSPGRVYLITIIISFGVGALSWLSPTRAFSSCFLGIFIIIFFFGVQYPIAFTMLTFAMVSGLFGMAGAIMRNLVLGENHSICLEFWQWAFLIMGTTMLADSFILPIANTGLMKSSDYSFYPRYAGFSMGGILVFGVFAGAFYNLDHRRVMQQILKWSLSGHALFLVLMGLTVMTGGSSRNVLNLSYAEKHPGGISCCRDIGSSRLFFAGNSKLK
jgi:hypothetical protein